MKNHLKKIKQRSVSCLLITSCFFILAGCDLDKSVRELGTQKPESAEPSVNSRSADVEENTARPADEFIVSTLNQVPGYKIRNSQGYYCRMFAFDGYNYSSHFNQVIAEIIQEGKKNGAHALVNMSTTAIPFNQMIKEEAKSPASGTSSASAIPSIEVAKAAQPAQFTNSQSIVQVCGDMVEIQNAAGQ